MRKAILDATGVDISQMTPELAARLKNPQTFNLKFTAASQNYNPPSKLGALGLLQELTGKGFDVDPNLLNELLRCYGILVFKMAQKLGTLKILTGAVAGGVAGNVLDVLV